MKKFWCFFELIAKSRMEKNFKCHKSQYLCIHAHKKIRYFDFSNDF